MKVSIDSSMTSQFDDMNETIKKVIHEEEQENNVFKGLDPYIEEPFNIIESYFKGQHLERLVRHQTESYNDFVNNLF